MSQQLNTNPMALHDRITEKMHEAEEAVKSLRRAWAYAKKEAKIHRELRLYDLRHAFASNALRYGADLKSVSKLVGHSREDTTLRVYQHVVDEQMRDAVLQLGMRFFWTYRALMK